jgi:hypothetical protein
MHDLASRRVVASGFQKRSYKAPPICSPTLPRAVAIQVRAGDRCDVPQVALARRVDWEMGDRRHCARATDRYRQHAPTALAPVTGLRHNQVRLAVAVHVGPARRATRLDPLTAIRHD